MKNSKIYKVAGLSLLGFCAVSIGVDRANIGPIATQVAGFCGAFAGALVAQRRKRPSREVSKSSANPEAAKDVAAEPSDPAPQA